MTPRTKVMVIKRMKQTRNQGYQGKLPKILMRCSNPLSSVYVEVHPMLLAARHMAEVERELDEVEARLVLDEGVVEVGLVMWSRKTPNTYIGNKVKEKCDHALYVYCAEELAELVCSRTLSKTVTDIKELAGSRLTIVIYGTKDYFKSTRRATANKKVMTEMDLELAITDLMVTADCDTSIVNTPKELALLIVQFTKAIASERQEKELWEMDGQAAFYMRGDNKNCVTVTKDGVGVDRLWQQMIAILPQSSLETSRALCAKYKSPIELSEALLTSDGVNELADIGVVRAAAPGSKARKIGPEFARKMKLLFTAEDGNILVE